MGRDKNRRNMMSHPYINYGKALVMVNKNRLDIAEISKEDLIEEIQNGINHFRIKPNMEITDQTSVKFDYADIEKGDTKKGIYLSCSILASDKGAVQVYSALKKMKEELGKAKSGNVDITRAITPVSGEFASFGKSIGRGKPKTDVNTAAYCAITTSTHQKPCMAFKTLKKDKPESENIAIIPDLEIPALVDFINLFEQLRLNSTEKLMIGGINPKDKKPYRPRIFDGNFPNAPRTSSLGAIGLLGSIGAWAREASQIDWAKKVLDSLIERPIYLIGTKTFETFTYNSFVVELAKENKLKSIIDSIYYIVLYNQGFRSRESRFEYQKFDLFASRFLQLFNRPSFKDFLAFRGEYPNQLEILLKTYFINMEKISPEVVKSARELGKWLNYASYKVAEAEVGTTNKEKLRERKAKALVEIESSIFSARSGDALIFQAITRAGRSSGLDAPSESELFMTQATTGEISLESAKHLLIAFSRVKNKYEPRNATAPVEVTAVEEEDTDDAEDLSDAQE
jgi:CRISPR-associated protein Cas8c/Csp2